MNKKRIILSIIILAIVGTFIAYEMYNKPHINVADTKSDIVLTADKILNDFSSDENAANTKYLEKIIEIKGTISNIKILNDKGIVTLKTSDDFGSVMCHLSETSTKKISSFKEGQKIKIKGICTGYLMDVILVKCEIITN